MRPSLALTIGALAFVASGLPFVLVPAESLTLVGWPPPSNSTVVLARDGGLMMLGLAIVDWFGRTAAGSPLRGLLWGNLFIRLGGALANGWEFAIGLTPPSVAVGLAAAILVDIVLIVMFALALRRAEMAGT